MRLKVQPVRSKTKTVLTSFISPAPVPSPLPGAVCTKPSRSPRSSSGTCQPWNPTARSAPSPPWRRTPVERACRRPAGTPCQTRRAATKHGAPRSLQVRPSCSPLRLSSRGQTRAFIVVPLRRSRGYQTCVTPLPLFCKSLFRLCAARSFSPLSQTINPLRLQTDEAQYFYSKTIHTFYNYICKKVIKACRLIFLIFSVGFFSWYFF